MPPQQAKRIIQNALDELRLPYTKLTAKTISFIDLARDKCVFVQIHGWQPNPAWKILKQLAHKNGFRIEIGG